jgi:hypothetical protein
VHAFPRPGGGLVVEIRLPAQGQSQLDETVRVRAIR